MSVDILRLNFRDDIGPFLAVAGLPAEVAIGQIARQVNKRQRIGVGVEVAMEAGRGQRVAEVGVCRGEAAELGVVEASLEVVEPRLGVELVAGVGESIPGEARG